MSTPPPSRSRLGRGLNALFSGDSKFSTVDVESIAAEDTRPAEITPRADDSISTVQTQLIDVNPHQPRRTFEDASLQELAASLKTNGLIQPIVVRQTGDRFELIAGERRLRAARLAGIAELPAVIREVDRPTQAQWALVENIQREDLNPVDRAAAYRDLMAQLGLTQAELANRLGEQRSSVANYLRLLELEESVRQLVANSTLSLGHAKVLAGVADKPLQASLAQRCVSQGLSVRELEKILSGPAEIGVPNALPVQASAHLLELECRLTQHVGLRVTVQKASAKGKGKVVIHYASLNQFDDLLKKLGYEATEQ